MVQETHMEKLPKLPRYHVHASPPSARTSNAGVAQGVCTFVRKGLTLIKLDHFLDCDTALELCAVEVVIGRKKQESVFLQDIAPTIEDLEEWTRSLVDAAECASTEIETDDTTSPMDTMLAHLIEARQSLQRRWKRMRHSRTLRKRIAHLGREIEKKILRRIGLRSPKAESYRDEAPEHTEIGRDIARHLVVLPLPRNIHPQRNKERRVARARVLAETHARDSTAVYVNAAKHQYRPHTYVAVVVRATDGKLLNACSVRATSAQQAEEAAIALALNGTPPSHHHPERLPHGHGQFRPREHRNRSSKPAAEKQSPGRNHRLHYDDLLATRIGGAPPTLSLTEYVGFSDDTVDILVERAESVKLRLKHCQRMCRLAHSTSTLPRPTNAVTRRRHDGASG
ncbi:hypothetical protein MRX96_049386 [Rhipicephalus microplus]